MQMHTVGKIKQIQEKLPHFTVSERSIMMDEGLSYNRHVLLSSQPYDTTPVAIPFCTAAVNHSPALKNNSLLAPLI